MTEPNDREGRRAFFSEETRGMEPGSVDPNADGPGNVDRHDLVREQHGPLDLTVHCEQCHNIATISIKDLAIRTFPLPIVMPWKSHPIRGRCPSCGATTWLSIRRA